MRPVSLARRLRASSCALAALSVSRAAIAAIKLLSRPPLRSTPYGTSLIKRLRTAASSVSRSSTKSAALVGRGSPPSGSVCHHDGLK